ncbi:MAG: hypothetical protein ABI967_12285 [bacterium]
MTPTQGSSLRHYLTLRRVFVWAFLLSLLSLAIRQSVSIDNDFWWHLKSGQYILQNASIPHFDPFSFTKGGSEWIAHEWLSEVIMYAIFQLGGWTGLLLGFGIIITASLGICYYRCDGKPFIAGLAVFSAAMASAPLFGLRPQMFTFLLASVFLAVLDRHLIQASSRLLWLLPALMLLWVNLHAGFAMGLALILLFIVMAVLDKEWKKITPLLKIFFVCVVVIPLNPNTFRMFSYPLETLSSPAMQTLIQEWFSPDFHQERFLPLAVLMLATFAVLAVSPRRVRAGELLGLLVLSLAALRSGRHIPLFAIFSAPIFARHLHYWTSTKKELITMRQEPATTIQIILNLALLLLPTVVIIRQLIDFKNHEDEYVSQRFPRAAVDFLQTNPSAGPMFNDYNWGGYLIWRLYPEGKVFIDGRADVYGDDFVFEYLRTYQAEPNWRDRLDRYGIRTVLIEPHSHLANLLREEKGWRKVFEDPGAAIFMRD